MRENNDSSSILKTNEDFSNLNTYLNEKIEKSELNKKVKKILKINGKNNSNN